MFVSVHLGWHMPMLTDALRHHAGGGLWIRLACGADYGSGKAARLLTRC